MAIESYARVFYVYILFDLRGVPLYVGKGKGDRWYAHESSERHNNRHNNTYLRAVVREAKRLKRRLPRVKIREGLTETEAFATEIALIAAIGRKDLGTGPLANLTEGGDGPTPSAEHVRKITAARLASPKQQAAWLRSRGRASPMRGRRHKAKSRAKTSAALAGRPKTPEHVRNVTEALRNSEAIHLAWTPDRRHQMGMSNKEKPRRQRRLTAEQAAEISKRLAAGVRLMTIARELNIDHHTLRKNLNHYAKAED